MSSPVLGSSHRTGSPRDEIRGVADSSCLFFECFSPVHSVTRSHSPDGDPIGDVGSCGVGYGEGEGVPLLYGLDPMAGPLPTVLVLGTFPSTASRREGAYYANPRNQFWPIVEALFGISRALPYKERIHALAGHGVALWDTVSACHQEGSMDHTIRNPQLNDIPRFLRANPTVSLVAVNGRTAERFLKRVMLTHPFAPDVRVVVLPSTSPANAVWNLQRLIDIWREALLAE